MHMPGNKYLSEVGEAILQTCVLVIGIVWPHKKRSMLHQGLSNPLDRNYIRPILFQGRSSPVDQSTWDVEGKVLIIAEIELLGC
jgi:hypothetical protein